MQPYKTSTWKQDILIQGKGVGYKEPSKWYRQVGDEYGSIPIIAKFRPSGWHKSYEYEVKFNDKNNEGYSFEIRINRTNDRGTVLSSIPMIKARTSVTPKSCPFCASLCIFDRLHNRWKCSSYVCQFDYTPDTCRLMFDEFKEMDNGVGINRRMFQNFNSLGTLGYTGDMTIEHEVFEL